MMIPDPAASRSPTANGLPRGWVYLSDVDPSIDQDMRYATADNFTGKIVAGYHVPECILRKAAAHALKRLQSHLERQGLGLRVYDCYRPVRAVRAFGTWSRQPSPPEEKQRYFPRLSKTQLYGKGYIAKRSNHSRGSTVDLTLVPLAADTNAIIPPPQAFPAATDSSCILPKAARVSDNSLDMGTDFDCFDVLTHTRHRAITGQARRNRMLLLQLMRQFGFRNYHMEWWHFTYHEKATPRTHYDFPIVRKKARRD